jgi:cell division transport system permease protein
MARILYFFRSALTHLGRSPAVAGVTIATVAVVFLLLGVFALLGHNMSLLAQRLGKDLHLSVFLMDDCPESQREVIGERLQAAEHVSHVEFVSRKDALERFRKRLGPDASILDGLGENPMPASFEVTFHGSGQNPRSIGTVAQKVVNIEGVEEVQYGQAWLDKFFSFAHNVRFLGLIIGALILLAAMVIVSNTIRLSVYARRDEIQILKLVGATDGFIKVPFYIEGVLLGLTGAGFGTAMTWLVFAFVLPDVAFPASLSQSRIGLQFLPHIGITLMVLGGAFLGVFGTFASLWRHMRV